MSYSRLRAEIKLLVGISAENFVREPLSGGSYALRKLLKYEGTFIPAPGLRLAALPHKFCSTN